ncbi:hypothetical protein ACFYR1_11050 [Streptomyces canus]|uniref:hypothetical protein n=1 Tax=Streptomyces canus TaxID=58343 RepID=UPI0036B60257
MHDRVAELAGLRAELAICENGPRESRREKTGEVRAEIDRVRGELEAEAEKLEEHAEKLASDGQDVPAAQAAVAAREIRTAVEDNAPTTRGGPRTKETAADSRPKETASARGNRASGKS